VSDLFGQRRYRHLRAVTPRPAGSIEFALMAIGSHAEVGEHQAMITAIADALWLYQLGRHEQLEDERVFVLIRRFAGPEWVPASLDDGGDEAA
jgi:hypothetical protein